MENQARLETRAFPGGELRISGRTVSGVVMQYLDVADMGEFREQFLPGAFGEPAEIEAGLNILHNESRQVAETGAGLVFRDDGERLLMSASMPNTKQGDEALRMIRDGRLSGLSVEFRSKREKFTGDLRQIIRATLGGLGLVDRPAYSGSEGLEVRRKARRILWPSL